MSLNEPLRARIATIIRENDVVLFMKGTRTMPQCGFSAQVVSILDEHLPTYQTVDVLSDPALRDGIKEFSSWPTIPQLYIRGEFIGGCDIVKELHATGELVKALGLAQGAPQAPPAIRVTQAAVAAFAAARESDADFVHIEIDPSFNYGLYFGPRQAGDVEVEAGGVVFLLDRASARRAEGLSIDFVEGPSGGGFKLESPNDPPKVKQLSPAALKAMLDGGEALELFDVRTDQERTIAKIAGARRLDQEGQQRLETLAKDARIVFHCHHGGRSQAAAEHYLAKGFRNVYNLQGGIDAWSREIDPSVPRY
ncbi:glutaredoxin [Sorangium cellulosum]|uniref:Probable monothiol glutaredoxin 2 n=2 Tax=Sorangium cellulosum TaxID=56 RepID=A0A150P665_SORCE|nr:Grx4 family monothiol glutaredoxin [Sorangium cellulosum]AGP39830.1 glutaredoxin [Sorangium cellulosum So0157-2]KYF51096.1 glutaredoxin [Sorangium cellulosum]